MTLRTPFSADDGAAVPIPSNVSAEHLHDSALMAAQLSSEVEDVLSEAFRKLKTMTDKFPTPPAPIMSEARVILDRDLMTPRRRHIAELFESARNFAPTDELLDVAQVAQRLGLPKSTVYELTRQRAHIHNDHPLPCFKVGRRLKFNWTTVMAWLTELEKEAGAP